MVSDLDEMSLDPEFSLLGIGGIGRLIRQHMSHSSSATLTISGAKLVVSTMQPVGGDEGGDEEEEGSGSLEYKSVVLVEASVVQVLCCSQVSGCGLQASSGSCLYFLILY